MSSDGNDLNTDNLDRNTDIKANAGSNTNTYADTNKKTDTNNKEKNTALFYAPFRIRFSEFLQAAANGMSEFFSNSASALISVL